MNLATNHRTQSLTITPSSAQGRDDGMTQISDRGELDYLTPQPTEADAKTADDVRHAIAQQRYYLNTQDRVRAEQVKARAQFEQAERDYHHHNWSLDGQS